MFIDIKDITAEGRNVSGCLNLGVLPLQQQETIEVTEAAFKAFFYWSDKGLCLKGKVDFCVLLNCSRCLENFSIPIKSEFNLKLKEEREHSQARNDALEEVEIETFPVKESRIDMREVLSEQIYLNIPLKPLCKEDCLGLCSICGGNLNSPKCDCQKNK